MEKIFLLIGLPVIGELSPESKVTRIDICQKCTIYKEEHSDIRYIMDSWGGEALFTGLGILYASESLKSRFEQNEIKGVQFEKIQIIKGPHFYFREEAGTNQLPSFYRMIVKGRAEGPETWWQSERCSDCEKTKWKLNLLARKSRMEPKLLGGREVEIIPREVYYASWKGEDMFYLQDPEKTPIITEKVVSVLQELTIPDLYYRETNWVF